MERRLSVEGEGSNGGKKESTLNYNKYVSMALGITSQDWREVGLGDDPSVALPSELSTAAERITALLLIRIVAWTQPRGTFSDLSTTTICRRVLASPTSWPKKVSRAVFLQLQKYVMLMLSAYQDVPYHNFQHCYHVTISANKLMDMIIYCPPSETKTPNTFGYRDDPLMQLVQLFAALIHDVEHKGIPNRQLVIENDELALQYNDQSIAEMRSLTVAFSELLKPDYKLLRSVLFPTPEDYRRFRAATVNVVLSTDLASPDRAQLVKSKWKEAFGETYETVERKLLKQMERRASLASGVRNISGPRRQLSTQSIMSELTQETIHDKEDDDESLSLSSRASDDNDQQRHQKINPQTPSPKHQGPVGGGKSPIFRPPNKGDSQNNRRHQLTRTLSERINRESKDYSGDNNPFAGIPLKFQRRLSSIGPGTPADASKRYRHTRLGLLRTVDLTGEAIEAYQSFEARLSATGGTTDSSLGSPQSNSGEEIHQLRESVVMETIMKASDVAHNLQSWDHMTKWSNQLFLELKRAYVQGRGEDPQGGWFVNQRGFLEAYLLPLARRLDDTGVFGDSRGSIFATIVEENTERWSHEGASLTANVICEGHLQYPEIDSDDELGV